MSVQRGSTVSMQDFLIFIFWGTFHSLCHFLNYVLKTDPQIKLGSYHGIVELSTYYNDTPVQTALLRTPLLTVCP